MKEEMISSEHEALERDILELSKELNAPGEQESSKETIKKILGERIYQSPLPPTPEELKPPPISPKKVTPLPRYAEDLPAQARLKAEELIDLAWHKGIMKAIKEVRKTDPLTMDVFHDAITEKLYQEFKKRGLLK